MSEQKFKCAFQVSGKVLEIGDVQTFASGFTKRTVIVEASRDAEKFSNPIALTLKKDACAEADGLNVGDFIEAEGYVEGRRWEGERGVRHFIDLSAKSLNIAERAVLPTTAKTWKELVTLGKAYGEAEADVVERAKALGKPFAAMGEADWANVAADIVSAHGPKTDDGGEDLPF